jgi:hypothetical protein
MSIDDQNTQKSIEQYKKEYNESLLKRANKKFSEKKNEPEPEKKNILQKAKSFAESMVSRGLSNKKCSQETKDLRSLSCHGDGNLPPCSSRRVSEKYEGSFYCGACGCGDKSGTQLVNITVNGDYCKLDYPKVSCPLHMPGFTDYSPSDEDKTENSRKKDIENRYGIEYIKTNSNPK